MITTLRWLAPAAVLLGFISSASAQGAFYDATDAEITSGPPGSVIRSEPMNGAPAFGIAHRVLYRSTGMKGEPIFVSGVVIVPPGDPPPEGRPIVAWAHPTSGITPRCAPSTRASAACCSSRPDSTPSIASAR